MPGLLARMQGAFLVLLRRAWTPQTNWIDPPLPNNLQISTKFTEPRDELFSPIPILVDPVFDLVPHNRTCRPPCDGGQSASVITNCFFRTPDPECISLMSCMILYCNLPSRSSSFHSSLSDGIQNSPSNRSSNCLFPWHLLALELACWTPATET